MNSTPHEARREIKFRRGEDAEFSAIVKFSRGSGADFNTARAVKFKRDKILEMKFN